VIDGTTTIPRFRRGRVIIGQVFVNVALFATSAAAVSVLLPGRVAALDPHGKVAALAVILSISYAVTALAQPLIGTLSDRTSTRFGRRLPWMIAGAIVGGIALGVLGGATSVVLVAVLWAVAQVSLSGVQVSTDSYLVDVFAPGRRGLAAGLVGLAAVVGVATGALLAASFASRPTAAFVVFAAGIAGSVVIFAILVRDAPLPRRELPRRRMFTILREGVRSVATHPDYIKILLWRFAYSIAYGTVFAYLLYVVTDLIDVPKVEAAHVVGIATALGGVATAASVVLGGWLSDRTSRRRTFLVVGAAVIILGDLVLLVSPTVPSVLATAALFGVGFGLSASCGRALASQLLPNPVSGAAAGLGMLNTAANVGQALAPVIGALVIGLAGYPAVFVTSIVGAAVCLVAVTRVKTVR